MYMYVMLGEFNVCVGSGAAKEDEWQHERAPPMSFGHLNEAGRELLAFISTKEATMCNTWFQKRF